eukprot:TRINITY_DN308_c0_g2_i1.p1 TRINITY_DN308_c0_g2~~TRINITY_DN308_c0_g2_i1.p1  ORF type:complete len:391 (+),score=155.55 TRINITY_DN308_c0_g2_i1:31-1203(+)
MSVEGTINIDRRCFRYVIGNKGSNIKDIIAKTQSKIDLSNDNDEIKITSENQEKYNLTVELINETISPFLERLSIQDNSVQIVLSIPKQLHGRLIGPGGSNLKEISQASKARISFPGRHENTEDVTISGLSEQVEKAKELIEAKIEELNSNSNNNNNNNSDNFEGEAELYEVGSRYFGVIIGKRGSTINDIKQQANVNIIVPDNGDSIKIIGTDENRQNAKNIISFLINKHDQIRIQKSDENAEKTDEYYNKYRKDMEKHVQARNRLFKEAEEAFKRGDGALAKELSEQAKNEDKLFQKARLDSALKIFKAQNKGRSKSEIDLHGLQVDEALFVVDNYLNKKKTPTLTIITGKGLHSEGHKFKIGPALEEHLNQKNIPFTHEEGKLVITF